VAELRRFWDFFDNVPEFVAVSAELTAKHPDIKSQQDVLPHGQILVGNTESENAAIGYEILRRTATEKSHPQELNFLTYAEAAGNLNNMLEWYRKSYLDPFYEYTDEQIQDRDLVLAQVTRFKHLAEWFRRGELWEVFKTADRNGERRLAFKLYQYLYEQGIDFSIEPSSASGEVDMIGMQTGRKRLLADIKVFDGVSRNATYIHKGLDQVYNYLQDFNQAIGYLVVFKATPKNIRVQEARDGEFPHVVIGHKTILLVDIDIYPHENPRVDGLQPRRKLSASLI
jgi:hypothetical protein